MRGTKNVDEIVSVEQEDISTTIYCPKHKTQKKSSTLDVILAFLPHREFSRSQSWCEKSKQNFPIQNPWEKKPKLLSYFPSALLRNETETETRRASKYFSPISLSLVPTVFRVRRLSSNLDRNSFGFRSTKQKKKEKKFSEGKKYFLVVWEFQ
jgi:hypothetical protein